MLIVFFLKASYRVILSYFCSLQLHSNSISVANKVIYPFCQVEELPGERSFILKNVQGHLLLNNIICRRFSTCTEL